MTTIAEQVAEILRQSSTFTIYGGYALHNGKHVSFKTGVQELETRNNEGQVAHARYHYSDGSRLTYKRKPGNAFTITTSCAPKPSR